MLQYKSLDAAFHALADPTRRAMIERLSQGPASVSDLAAPFPMTMSAIVQHLKILEGAGIVTSQKVGRVRTCAVAPDRLAAAEAWLTERRAAANRRFDRLDALLKETDPKNPTQGNSR